MLGDIWSAKRERTKATVLNGFDRKAVRPIRDADFWAKRKRLGQAKSLVSIERFVDMVLNSRKPAYFCDRKSPDGIKETYIGKRLRQIVPLVKIFDSNHFYSEKPAVFLRAFWLVERIFGHQLTKPMYQAARPDMRRAEIMNYLVDSIRFEARQAWFGRCVSDRKYEADHKAKSLAEYATALFRYHAKVLVVRVDLSYEGGADAAITIDRLYGDLHEFLGLKEYHSVFEHLIGYAWTVEQGERKGFHVHALFFFNGSMVRQDVTLGFVIGNLWVRRITNLRGRFYNCNANKPKYEHLGIGLINRQDEEACMNAIHCVQYLAKGGPFIERDDQYLRMRPFGARTFGTGLAPDIEAKSRGRPAADIPWLEMSPVFGK